jgi:hypothetical protein
MQYHRRMNRYTYRAEWSSEYREYVGRCIELPWLSQWAPTMQKAIAKVELAQTNPEEYIADCEGAGGDVPPPLTERRFSGKFLVRASRCTHG